MQVNHDNEGEFTGFAFQQLIKLLNIKSIPTITKNPQFNTICKQMHQTVATALKTILLGQPPQSHCQMMPWLLPCMPCGPRSQLSCRLHLEDLCSLKTCFSKKIFLQIDRQSFHKEKNWSMMPCFVPTKSVSIMTTRLGKKSSSMTERSMANLKLKLQDPLTFFESTPTAL